MAKGTPRIGSIVRHPFMIGKDNRPLKGKVTQIQSQFANWLILWDGDKKPEICDRSDFIVPRGKK